MRATTGRQEYGFQERRYINILAVHIRSHSSVHHHSPPNALLQPGPSRPNIYNCSRLKVLHSRYILNALRNAAPSHSIRNALLSPHFVDRARRWACHAETRSQRLSLAGCWLPAPISRQVWFYYYKLPL